MRNNKSRQKRVESHISGREETETDRKWKLCFLSSPESQHYECISNAIICKCILFHSSSAWAHELRSLIIESFVWWKMEGDVSFVHWSFLVVPQGKQGWSRVIAWWVQFLCVGVFAIEAGSLSKCFF